MNGLTSDSLQTFTDIFDTERKQDSFQTNNSNNNNGNLVNSYIPDRIENIKALNEYNSDNILDDINLRFHHGFNHKTNSIDTTNTTTTMSSNNTTFSSISKQTSSYTTSNISPSKNNIPMTNQSTNAYPLNSNTNTLPSVPLTNNLQGQNIKNSSDTIISTVPQTLPTNSNNHIPALTKTDKIVNRPPIPHASTVSVLPTDKPVNRPPIPKIHSIRDQIPELKPSIPPHPSASQLQSDLSKSKIVQPKVHYKKKPSLPQLSIGNLKKQSSSSSSTSPTAAVTPTQSNSRKSPLQGFGLFNRSTSRDIGENPNTSPKANNNNKIPQGQTSRTPSINSYSLKNFTSSLQSKNTNSQRSASSPTNPFSDFHSHNNNSNSNTGSEKLPKSVSSSSFSTSKHFHHIMSGVGGNSSSTGSLGLGLKTRQTSPSLGPKRYTSSTSLSSHIHSSRRTPSVLSNARNPYTTRKPLVYPAILSKVSNKFKKLIQLGEHKKDGLVYRDAFTGSQAVDTLCYILKNSDRNLALLLGRALDAQKFFHDVVYEHRLRDSSKEVYEFSDFSRIIGSGSMDLISGEANTSTSSLDPNVSITSTSTTLGFSKQDKSLLPSTSFASLNSDGSSNSQINIMNSQVIAKANKTNKVCGVFTLLSHCYSPTCTRDHLCYSISCPRRLEQQSRLNNFEHRGLRRNISLNLDDDEEEKTSWTSSVPQEIWENLSKKEIKRQEAIYEVFITEKKFVRSLETTRDTFMKTLSETNIIPADIRKNFIKHVFAHVNDIYSVNRRFLEALSDRQKSSPVVRGVGDIILRFIPYFEPFVSYVASRPYAKYLIETQRSVNPYFARFDDDMMNSSLRHGIDSFLSQGVSRPGRYMLLVREIINASNEDNDKRDLECLNNAMTALKAFMKRIDVASGAAQDRHDVKLLKQNILFKNEYVNMGLNNEKRKIRYDGILSKRETPKFESSSFTEIQFYLLDNMLLFLKAKAVNKWHQRKVFLRPIPLPLLFAAAGEEMPSLKGYIGSKPDCSGIVVPTDSIENSKNAITFFYYAATHRYMVTLYAGQHAGLQTLLDKIRQEQERIISDTHMFNVTKISDKFFDYSNKINSVVSCDGGRKLLIATNSGLYSSNIRRQAHSAGKKATITFSTPIQLVQKNNVQQVSALEEFKCLIILVDKKLYSCSYELFSAGTNGTSYFKKHAKELINHVHFFSEGNCNGKKLIVSAHSHSIKYFELEHPLLSDKGSGKKSLKKKIMEIFFDSEPVSISFLKSHLCIGCKRGFQIVSITQNVKEPLLDPADTSLEFALKDTLKPMAIYRVDNMFLLCYTEFAFFVNNQGWRKKDSDIIYWEGQPQKFAIWHPYILAFDSNFIEIRQIDNGELVRCVIADKIRLLQSSSQEILYAYEDNNGFDTVASLDFWG